MSATAAPYGLRPVRSLSSGGYASGHTRLLKVTDSYGTSIFYGDVVKLTATGTVEKDTGTDAATPVGVFLGCEYTDPNLNYKLHSNMWLASTTATDIMAYVADDPNMLFQIQSDTTLAQTTLGLNYSLVQTAGNTAIGMSKVALDGDTGATTNTLPVRIVDFVYGPDSAPGDAYTDVIVKFNAGHQYLNTQGL